MRTVFLVWTVLLGLFAAPAEARLLSADLVREPQSLLPYCSWLSDPKGAHTVESVSSGSLQERFAPLNRQDMLKSEGPVWLRLVMLKSSMALVDGPGADNGARLVLNLGQIPSGKARIFFSEPPGPVAAEGLWHAEDVSAHENILLPEPGLTQAGIYIRLAEMPGLWFAPVIRPEASSKAALLPWELILPGLLIAAAVACLLRAVADRSSWGLWAGLFALCCLVQAALPLPAAGGGLSFDRLPSLLAPGLALLLLPHVGRCLFRTDKKRPLQDIWLYAVSVLGLALALAPFIPGLNWLVRLFPLWPLLLVLLLPICFKNLADGKAGALPYLGVCLLPALGAGLTLYVLFEPSLLHPLTAQAGLWGLAVGCLGLALTRGLQAQAAAEAAGSAQAEQNGASAGSNFLQVALQSARGGNGQPLPGRSHGPSGELSYFNLQAFAPDREPSEEELAAAAAASIEEENKERAEDGRYAYGRDKRPVGAAPEDAAAGSPLAEAGPEGQAGHGFAQTGQDAANNAASHGQGPESAPTAQSWPAALSDQDTEDERRQWTVIRNLSEEGDPAVAAAAAAQAAQEQARSEPRQFNLTAFSGALPEDAPEDASENAPSSAPAPVALSDEKQGPPDPAATPAAGWQAPEPPQARPRPFASVPEAEEAASARAMTAAQAIAAQAAARGFKLDAFSGPVPEGAADADGTERAPSAPGAEGDSPVDAAAPRRPKPGAVPDFAAPPLSESREAAESAKIISLIDEDLSAYVPEMPESFEAGSLFDPGSLGDDGVFLFSLHSLVRDVHDVVEPLAKAKGLIFSWYINPSLPSLLEGDAPRLRGALSLLLQNAVQVTRKGAVQLAVRRNPVSDQPGDLLFTISDNGSTQRTDAGFFHAWELAARSGGSFNVEYAPHSGTQISFTVRFDLPTAQAARDHMARHPFAAALYPELVRDMEIGQYEDEPMPVLHSQDPTALPDLPDLEDKPLLAAMRPEQVLAEHGKYALGSPLPTVLAGEMTSSNRRLLTSCLADVPHEHINAESNEQVLEYYQSNPVGLIIFDADTPEPDVMRSIASLRKEDARMGRATPVLVLTTHTAQSVRMLEAGASYALRKPYKRQALRDMAAVAVPAFAPFVLKGDGRAPSEALLKNAEAGTAPEALRPAARDEKIPAPGSRPAPAAPAAPLAAQAQEAAAEQLAPAAPLAAEAPFETVEPLAPAAPAIAQSPAPEERTPPAPPVEAPAPEEAAPAGPVERPLAAAEGQIAVETAAARPAAEAPEAGVDAKSTDEAELPPAPAVDAAPDAASAMAQDEGTESVQALASAETDATEQAGEADADEAAQADKTLEAEKPAAALKAADAPQAAAAAPGVGSEQETDLLAAALRDAPRPWGESAVLPPPGAGQPGAAGLEQSPGFAAHGDQRLLEREVDLLAEALRDAPQPGGESREVQLPPRHGLDAAAPVPGAAASRAAPMLLGLSPEDVTPSTVTAARERLAGGSLLDFALPGPDEDDDDGGEQAQDEVLGKLEDLEMKAGPAPKLEEKPEDARPEEAGAVAEAEDGKTEADKPAITRPEVVKAEEVKAPEVVKAEEARADAGPEKAPQHGEATPKPRPALTRQKPMPVTVTVGSAKQRTARSVQARVARKAQPRPEADQPPAAEAAQLKPEAARLQIGAPMQIPAQSPAAATAPDRDAVQTPAQAAAQVAVRTAAPATAPDTAAEPAPVPDRSQIFAALAEAASSPARALEPEPATAPEPGPASAPASAEPLLSSAPAPATPSIPAPAKAPAFALPGMEGEFLDPAVVPLVPGIIHALRQALADTKAAVEQDKSILVQEASGRLASKAEHFDLLKLGKIARCVERAAEAGDMEAVGTLMQDLGPVTERYVAALDECFSAFLNVER